MNLRQISAIVFKDLAAELRTRELFSAMFVFALLSMLIFSFALDLQGNTGKLAAPGVLWTTIAFSGTLGLSRSMTREQQSGAIDGLLIAVADRNVILFGKMIGNLVMMCAVEVILLPLGTVLFDVNLLQPGVIMTMIFGTYGYAVVGTLIASMAVNTRAREIMLPIMLLPLVVPLLIGVVRVTSNLVQGLPWVDSSAWMQIVVVYDLVMTAVAVITVDYVFDV